MFTCISFTHQSKSWGGSFVWQCWTFLCKKIIFKFLSQLYTILHLGHQTRCLEVTTYIHLAGIDKLLLSIKSAYGLLTKHHVKMAEYWPNFFLYITWKRTRPISSYLHWKSLIGKELVNAYTILPRGQDSDILPIQIINVNTMQDLVHLVPSQS